MAYCKSQSLRPPTSQRGTTCASPAPLLSEHVHPERAHSMALMTRVVFLAPLRVPFQGSAAASSMSAPCGHDSFQPLAVAA